MHSGRSNTFSSDGLLSGVRVDGTALSPEEAYNLEHSFIHEAEIVEGRLWDIQHISAGRRFGHLRDDKGKS